MIGIIMQELTVAIIFLLASIVLHEYGHIRVITSCGYQPFYGFKKKSFFVTIPDVMTKKEKIATLRSGILLGFIPIVFSALIVPAFTISLIIIYFVGCHHDYKLLNVLKRK